MYTPAPIETRYNGYRFRSRTEARWAVFFDTLGVTWEYESEGYPLPCGWYLPDFWLPTLQVFVEVKGTHQDTLGEWERCKQLAVATGFPVMMVFGQFNPIRVTHIAPDDATFIDIHNLVTGSKRGWTPDGHFYDGGWEFGECVKCGAIGAGFYGEHTRCDCRCINSLIAEACGVWECDGCGAALLTSGQSHALFQAVHTTRRNYYDSPRLMEAYAAARSARFEFGETPKIGGRS